MARQLICCLVLMLLTPGVIGAVTLGAFGADDLVKQLRSSIFVETAFLEDPWQSLVHFWFLCAPHERERGREVVSQC